MDREHRDHSDTPVDDEPADAADARNPEKDVREDPYIAAERYLLEHPPTEEEIRSRDALLDKLDASDTPDDSPTHKGATSDLPFHVQDATADDTEPQFPTAPEKDENHAGTPSEDNIAPPAATLAERETHAPLESSHFTPPEELTPLPRDAQDEQARPSQLEPIRDVATLTDTVLQAIRDPAYREHLLQPRTFTPEAADRLLALRAFSDASGLLEATSFTHITDRATYEQALRAFPLIQEHPRFDALHRQVKLYFQLHDNPLQRTGGPFSLTSLTEYTDIARSTLGALVADKQRPHLLILLEERAATLKGYQEHVATLRDLDGGVTTVHDLARRLSPSHFMFGDQVVNDPRFTEQLAAASQYLATLRLVEAGYHPRDLEVHFHLDNGTLCDRLRYEQRPGFVRLAASIPEAPPGAGQRWLPTTSDTSKLPARYIQAPAIITDYKDLIPVVAVLPSPITPDHHLGRQLQEFGPGSQLLQKWEEQFGPIHTPHEKLNALAYLIGANLSDGCITRQSTFSSYYHIELSRKYDWSRAFGDRTAYYWTAALGIPVKPGSAREPPPGVLHGAHNWYSVTAPFLTWFHRTVLGLEGEQTHTSAPARIDWILRAPTDFQAKVLQGLFDGDGWADVSGRKISIQTQQNARLVHRMLERVGVSSNCDGGTRVAITSRRGIRAAVELPVFLSATGRQEKAEKILEMVTKGLASTTVHAVGLPVARRVLELGNANRSRSQIAERVLDEFGVALTHKGLASIFERGEDGLRINEHIVKTYFALLRLRQENPKAPDWQIVRQAKEGIDSSLSANTLNGWLRRRVPTDVELALSDGLEVEHNLLAAYPRLRQLAAEYSRQAVQSSQHSLKPTRPQSRSLQP